MTRVEKVENVVLGGGQTASTSRGTGQPGWSSCGRRSFNDAEELEEQDESEE
jgi:hypothetical protein